MLRDDIARYTELSGNDGEHTPIGIIGAFLDGYETGLKDSHKGEWIPVSERLPNLDDYTGSEVWQKKVLITGYLSFDDKKDPFVSEAFATDVTCNCVNHIVVTAWMPLPKPYRLESEE